MLVFGNQEYCLLSINANVTTLEVQKCYDIRPINQYWVSHVLTYNYRVAVSIIYTPNNDYATLSIFSADNPPSLFERDDIPAFTVTGTIQDFPDQPDITETSSFDHTTSTQEETIMTTTTSTITTTTTTSEKTTDPTELSTISFPIHASPLQLFIGSLVLAVYFQRTWLNSTKKSK